MRRSAFKARVLVAAVAALFRATVRRVARGPTLPSWTWSEELFVALFRATTRAGARNVAFMAPRRAGLRVPLSRATRRTLHVEEVDLQGVRAERYRPRDTAQGTIVWFHGGGFVAGGVGLERRVAAAQALASNCDTYSVEYRLAPRHPFPAALDDAVAAYRGVLDRGADPATTFLFGGSAGAGLALGCLLQLRDLDMLQPAGAVLLWPYADFTFSGDSIHTNADIDMLPLRDVAQVTGAAYVGDADPSDPLVSPALADLTGLPPLLIIAGGAESLLSCAQQIADHTRRDHVDAQFTVYADKVHGWMMLPKLPATLQAIDEINSWLAGHLAAASANASDLR